MRLKTGNQKTEKRQRNRQNNPVADKESLNIQLSDFTFKQIGRQQETVSITLLIN